MATEGALESPSVPLPSGQTEGAPVAAPLPARAPVLAVSLLFVGLFGVLLASFPARNVDVWKHLANGRALVHFSGEVGPTWLYDLLAYTTFSLGGGTGLAAVKALLCGAVAVLM